MVVIYFPSIGIWGHTKVATICVELLLRVNKIAKLRKKQDLTKNSVQFQALRQLARALIFVNSVEWHAAIMVRIHYSGMINRTVDAFHRHFEGPLACNNCTTCVAFVLPAYL